MAWRTGIRLMSVAEFSPTVAKTVDDCRESLHVLGERGDRLSRSARMLAASATSPHAGD